MRSRVHPADADGVINDLHVRVALPAPGGPAEHMRGEKGRVAGQCGTAGPRTRIVDVGLANRRSHLRRDPRLGWRLAAATTTLQHAPRPSPGAHPQELRMIQ